jgi:hypothetical protein
LRGAESCATPAPTGFRLGTGASFSSSSKLIIFSSVEIAAAITTRKPPPVAPRATDQKGLASGMRRTTAIRRDSTWRGEARERIPAFFSSSWSCRRLRERACGLTPTGRYRHRPCAHLEAGRGFCRQAGERDPSPPLPLLSSSPPPGPPVPPCSCSFSSRCCRDALESLLLSSSPPPVRILHYGSIRRGTARGIPRRSDECGRAYFSSTASMLFVFAL